MEDGLGDKKEVLFSIKVEVVFQIEVKLGVELGKSGFCGIF